MNKVFSLANYIFKNLDTFVKFAELRNIKPLVDELKLYISTYNELENNRHLLNLGIVSKEVVQENNTRLVSIQILDVINSFPNVLYDHVQDDVEVQLYPGIEPKHDSVISDICVQNNNVIRFLEWNEIGSEIVSNLVFLLKLPSIVLTSN
jgi:hypothetical protein